MKHSRRPKGYIPMYVDMTELEKADVEYILMKLGVEPECVDVPAVCEHMHECHNLAMEAGVPVTSPHFRYMIKRAYLHYASCLQLYGCSFGEGVLTLPKEEGGTSREVVIAINTDYLRLLDPQEWTLVMEAPLCDVESCRLVDPVVERERRKFEKLEARAEKARVKEMARKQKREAKRTEKAKAKAEARRKKKKNKSKNKGSDSGSDSDSSESESESSESESESSDSSDSDSESDSSDSSSGSSSDDSLADAAEQLLLDVNGMELCLVSPHLEGHFKTLQLAVLEALARGIFPHGTEGGNDVLNVGESIVPQGDGKIILQSFVKSFPNFQVPPAPAPLEEAPDFVELPKSRMVIMMEERAEEEMRELEQSRLAAESRAEKLQLQREQGKAAVKSMNNDEEEEEEEEEGEDGLSRRRKSLRTDGRGNSKDPRHAEYDEEAANAAISAAVAGVPLGGKSRVQVPELPPPKGGKLKVDRQERFRVAEKPVLRRTVLPDPLVPPPATMAAPLASEREYADTLRAFEATEDSNSVSVAGGGGGGGAGAGAGASASVRNKSRRTTGNDWDDSSVGFAQMARGYSSRKAKGVSTAKKVDVAIRKQKAEASATAGATSLQGQGQGQGGVAGAEEEDYAPVSPLKRKKPEIEDHDMLMAFATSGGRDGRGTYKEDLADDDSDTYT